LEDILHSLPAVGAARQGSHGVDFGPNVGHWRHAHQDHQWPEKGTKTMSRAMTKQKNRRVCIVMNFKNEFNHGFAYR
jgi:hypothetical protein